MPRIITFLQFTVDCLQSIIPRKNPTLDKLNKAKIIAHRGCFNNKDILENTLSAFRASRTHGAYGIEFDIRWTKDHIPIVHHDISTVRIFNQDINISSLTFNELRERFPLIPSLAEVVSEFGKVLHLFIELKIEDFPDIETKRNNLKNILVGLTPGEDYHIFSLYPEVLLEFQIIDKKHLLSISTTNPKKISIQTKELELGGFTGHYLLLTNKYLKAHRELNHKIGTGFPRNKSSLIREIEREVDFIFTNHAKKLVIILKKLMNSVSS